MQRSRLIRWGTLFLVSITLVLDDVLDRLFEAHRSIAGPTVHHATLLVPASFTFFVAVPLYGALVAYCVWQLLPAQRRLRPCDRLSESILVVSFLSTGWMISFEVGSAVLCAIVLCAMVSTAWSMFVRARVTAAWGAFPGWAPVAFSMLFGWLLVAALANVGALLVSFGHDPTPMTAAGMVAVLGVVAITVGLHQKDTVVPLMMAWGTFGIAVADWRTDLVVSSVAASAACAGVVCALLVGLGTLKAPWRLRFAMPVPR